MTNQNLKFLVCCANGSGSSLMAQMALEKVLKKNNINLARYIIVRSQKERAVQFSTMYLCVHRILQICLKMQKQRV